MRVRPDTEAATHRRSRAAASRRRTAWILRYAPYWIRMAAMGLATGILLAGLINQADTPVIHYDYPKPPTTASGSR